MRDGDVLLDGEFGGEAATVTVLRDHHDLGAQELDDPGLGQVEMVIAHLDPAGRGGVGYMASPHDAELMEFSDGPDAQAARRRWDDVEWERTFTSLNELLEAGTDRPEVSHPDALPNEESDSARKDSASVWSRLHDWVKHR